MMERTLREVFEFPSARDVAESVVMYWDRVNSVLASGWNIDEDRSHVVTALIGHAIDFWTWQSLVRQRDLTSEQAIDAMVRLVQCHTHHDSGTIDAALSAT
jgi:hypothetical protein